jgi:hypothetical protein
MNLTSRLLRLVCCAGIFCLLAMPMMAKADGLNLNVKIGGDDQAHFDFKSGPSHHHPMIWKAAQKLREAKHSLWKAPNDFNGHKADAIQAINAALEQLRICESK